MNPKTVQWRNNWNLVLNLARRDVASQFKRTTLGRLWSLINPLATILIFSLIFGLVFRGRVDPGLNSGIDSFALWIAAGVICWGFLSSCVSIGQGSLVSNAGLLTKVYFPRWILAVSGVVARSFNFLTELFVIVVVMALAGGPRVFLYVPVLLVISVLTAIFALGLGLMLSVATVYFRDMEHIWSIFNQVWMYASGVVFPLHMLDSLQMDLAAKGITMGGEPLPLTTIFRLNPAELFLEAYRACLYDFTLPAADVWLGCLAWTAVSLGLGVLVFRRLSDRIVEEL